jgi:hypothetical protein
VTKGSDESHKFFRALGVELGIGVQVFKANRGFQDDTGRKPYAVALPCPFISTSCGISTFSLAQEASQDLACPETTQRDWASYKAYPTPNPFMLWTHR